MVHILPFVTTRLLPYITSGLAGLFIGTEIGTQTAPPQQKQIIYGGTGTQKKEEKKEKKLGELTFTEIFSDPKFINIILISLILIFLLRKK